MDHPPPSPVLVHLLGIDLRFAGLGEQRSAILLLEPVCKWHNTAIKWGGRVTGVALVRLLFYSYIFLLSDLPRLEIRPRVQGDRTQEGKQVSLVNLFHSAFIQF